jgi:hypothetical protein
MKYHEKILVRIHRFHLSHQLAVTVRLEIRRLQLAILKRHPRRVGR